ncbi:hypothetical protein BH20ACT9_BH20ACT9_19970 [soil metagenome]
MLNHRDESIEGKTCTVSGSGNVAIYTAEKIRQLGGTVVSLSDSSGSVHDPDGVDDEKLAFVKELKGVRRGRIREYAERFGCEYLDGRRPWSIRCDAAFPSATQNELDAQDAKALLGNGCVLVAEGANMPSTPDAAQRFLAAHIMYGPGKAANAGGVAVSGLEQSQNALRIAWGREQVDQRLRGIMRDIHEQCLRWGRVGDHVDYVTGANLAAFVRVGEAMLAHGVV